MFQFKNAGLGMNEPDKSNALPNTFGKVRTFKEDLENFEKGVSAKPEDEAPLPVATQQPVAENRQQAENPPQRQELPQMKPVTPEPSVEYSSNNPFQSVPTPPPISSPGPIAGSDTQLPPFKSSPSQSFFSEKPASKESFFPEQAGNNNQPLPQKKSKGGFVLAIVVLLVVAVAGAGFYYYWFNMRGTSPAAPTTSSAPVPSATPQAETPTPTEPQNKNLRNIVIDTSLGQSEIKSAIQKFATDFSTSASESDLVEAKIVGKDGQPVGKKDFFSGVGVAIPDSVLMKLSEDYSLFARKESGSARLGFVFKSVTSSGLSDEMKNWEPTLPTDLVPLYAGQAPTGTGAFNSSQYKNADIRYFNFSSPADTSLDYSVISNFLVIGSSKDTTRAILDYMSQK